MKTKTIRQDIATEIFESTGFNYAIRETENTDGTVSLEFDSDEDFAKFEKMADGPDVEIHGTLDFDKTMITVEAFTVAGFAWLESKLGPATVSFKTRKSRVIEIEASAKSAGLTVAHL
jgi:hypothetical protein